VTAKPLVLACLILTLTACSAPAPQTIVATSTPIVTDTPTPPPPTETPTPTPEPTATPVPYRALVLERGNVICGVDPARPDYTPDGINFDIDVCRAIAAALFDTPAAIDARPLDAGAGLAALRSGEIDVYLGPIDNPPPDVVAGPALFIDATGVMARNDVNIRTLTDLKFTTVCLLQDSIDERLFDAALAAARVRVQAFLFSASDYDAMYATYDQGRCDAIVDNRVRLGLQLPILSAPREQGVLDVALLIGRRGLLTVSRDANWSEVIAAIGNGLIQAEELDVNSANLDDALAGDDPAVLQLFGEEDDIGSGLGLTHDFVARAIRHVGNYGEIYARHFPDLPRGPNALELDGGQIAPQ